MGMDAINKIVYGIKFENKEEFIKYFNFREDILDFDDEYGDPLYDVFEDLLHKPWDYDESFLIGVEIFGGDWDNGFEEIDYLFTFIEKKKFDAEEKLYNNLKSETDMPRNILDIRQEVGRLINYDNLRLYNYCNYW